MCALVTGVQSVLFRSAACRRSGRRASARRSGRAGSGGPARRPRRGSWSWARRVIDRDSDLHPPFCRRGLLVGANGGAVDHLDGAVVGGRSEEHTSELQSLMRISYAVFCLKKKNNKTNCLS